MTLQTNEPEAAPVTDGVTVTIDGFEITVPKGTLVIRAAELLGIQIPRFCDHPLLDPVGACRQCLVEVTGPASKPLASCTTTCTEGMVVQHPAHLPGRREGAARRDGAAAHQPPARLPDVRQGRRVPAAEPGHVQRPGRDPVHRGQADLPQAGRDLHRRCCSTASAASPAPAAPASPSRSPATRSSTSSSAGPDQFIGTADGKPFNSYFSGNTVQICPVGALTGAAYRFRARPFDLVSTPSVCEHCASGCRQRTDSPARPGHPPAGRQRPARSTRSGTATRAAGRSPTPTQPDRLITRWYATRTGVLVPASWPEALVPPRPGLAARRAAGPGVLTGGRLTLEDAYAYAKFARIALGTNDIDLRARPHSAEEAQFLAARRGRARASRSATPTWSRRPPCCWPGSSPRTSRPSSSCGCARRPARAGLKVYSLAPFASSGPGQDVGDAAAHRARASRGRRLLGRAGAAGDGGPATAAGSWRAWRPPQALAADGAVILAGERLAEVPGALSAAGHAGRRDRGAAGLGARAGPASAARSRPARCPACCPIGRPGRRRRRARAEVARAWGVGSLPTGPGRDATAILAAAADGELDALVIAGVDPDDLPDPAGRAAPRSRPPRSSSAWSCGPARSPTAPTWCCRSRPWRRRPARS